jgi:hypothetical protein
MKSPQIKEHEDTDYYCELAVLKSALGWYIGSMYKSPGELHEQGTRDSVEYYANRLAAQEALRTKSWTQRRQL